MRLMSVSIEITINYSKASLLSKFNLVLDLLVLELEVSKLSRCMLELLFLVVVEDSSSLEFLKMERLFNLMDVDLALDS